MPLQDHFRPPIRGLRHWTSVCTAWATFLAEDLNQRLPPGYVAEPNPQFTLEIDLAAWQEPGAPSVGASAWAPPPPTGTAPLTLTAELAEVRVLRDEGGLVLAGAVELVSPGNKDRPTAREAFVTRCAGYLHDGVGLIVLDPVTQRRANLHRELLDRLAAGTPSPEAELYAASYRPLRKNGESSFEFWHEALEVGRELPVLPFWLRGGLCLPVPFEPAYTRALRSLRFPVNGP
jgi:hypothetical protein